MPNFSDEEGQRLSDPMDEIFSVPVRLRSFEGLDLNRTRNWRQLILVLVLLSVGALCGAFIFQPDVLPGSLIGGFVGLVFGTLVGGIYAGHAARCSEDISRSELELRIATLTRVFRVCLPLSILLLVVGFASLPFLAHSSSAWGFVAFILIMTIIPGFKAYTVSIGQRLQQYRKLLETNSRTKSDLSQFQGE